MVGTDCDKHPSLLVYGINYDRKKFTIQALGMPEEKAVTLTSSPKADLATDWTFPECDLETIIFWLDSSCLTVWKRAHFKYEGHCYLRSFLFVPALIWDGHRMQINQNGKTQVVVVSISYIQRNSNCLKLFKVLIKTRVFECK
jgi:hypothetical protein